MLLITLTGLKARAEGSEAEESTSITLKVMSLNIHSGINWAGDYDPDGLMELIRTINPDLISMQEVDQNWSSLSQFQDLPALLAEGLGMYSAFSASLARSGGYFGNLILSKYPLTQIWSQRLSGSLETRSFVLTQVLVTGVRINFIGVHLGLSESDRMEQVTGLFEYLNLLDGPVLIGGDFNAGIGDRAIDALRESFNDLGYLSGQPEQGTFRGKTGAIGSRIDFLLASPEFSLLQYQVIDSFVSDHLPVVAEVSLTIAPDQIAGEPVSYQPSTF